MKHLLIIFLAGMLMISCEQTVTLDLNQAPSKIVIEGLLTNKPGYQSVKISRSVDFYASGSTPRITNAYVTVDDDAGNRYLFVHNPRQVPDSAGIYVPAIPFQGTIGRTYKLRVEVDGDVFEAEDQLLPITSIDSLNYRINVNAEEDPDNHGEIYEVRLYTREPQDQTNFYLFKFYRNDSLTFNNDTDIYYSDDQMLAENIEGIPMPILYRANDKARMEMFSLSRLGFVYYDDLSSLLNTDGGMFGPVPAAPRTNLTNGAYGFFQVSALETGEVEIK